MGRAGFRHRDAVPLLHAAPADQQPVCPASAGGRVRRVRCKLPPVLLLRRAVIWAWRPAGTCGHTGAILRLAFPTPQSFFKFGACARARELVSSSLRWMM